MKKYVVKGMTEWIEGWIRNKWRNSQKKELLAREEITRCKKMLASG